MRQSIADGIYYSQNPETLKSEIGSFLNRSVSYKKSAIGIIVPHDRYKLCGEVLGQVYASINIPETILLLGPNHSMTGKQYSLLARKSWKTPLGSSKINETFAKLFMENAPLLREDELSHLKEHALEIQLPFLQYLSGSFEFVPILFKEADQSKFLWDPCERIAEALAKTVKQYGEPVLIVASSNLNHYEDLKTIYKKDALMIEKIKNLDAKGLVEISKEHNMSLCGLTPLVILLLATQSLGATQGQLLIHTTSAEHTHDETSVVGYGGVVINY